MADDDNTVSRRDFIKTATASGVVAATTLVGAERRPAPVVRTTATARVIGANDRIRVGIVGVKTMGGGHLRTSSVPT